MNRHQAASILDTLGPENDHVIIETKTGAIFYRKYSYIIQQSEFTLWYSLHSVGPTGLMWHGRFTRDAIIDLMVDNFEGVPTQ